LASHLSSIGFLVESDQDFLDLADRAVSQGEETRSRRGVYRRWGNASGAELWAQVDRRGDLIGMNPHFAGLGRMRVGLTERLPPPKEESPLDGAFHGWLDPKERPERGECPFVFDSPDFDLHRSLRLPAVVELQLAAFAHELAIYASDAAYDAANTDGQRLAAESFIPSGLFSAAGGARRSPEAHAVLAGHVLAAEQRRNPDGGAMFRWLHVRTLGGTLDVVADPDLVAGTPAVGGVITGAFWLSGRLA
jgi:hypothetical protein